MDPIAVDYLQLGISGSKDCGGSFLGQPWPDEDGPGEAARLSRIEGFTDETGGDRAVQEGNSCSRCGLWKKLEELDTPFSRLAPEPRLAPADRSR